MSDGIALTSDVLGYEDTVLPQLETALLAGHDIILLGERGQAKTRMIRSLVELLDEWLPIVEGSEIRDDPFAPISAYAIDLVAREGRRHAGGVDPPQSQRFAEKLASPDTSMADLIGEVDPIKVAGGLFLDDPKALSYGLVPKSNRGIFAMNELPDLAERIQVGLLNVLEERDVQIRGHLVRLDLDVMVVATANPEDYTNRGRLITPLKDRFGSQIRTHYPYELTTEIAIMHQEATAAHVPGAHHGAVVHRRHRRARQSRRAQESRDQPELGRVGATLDRQLRDRGGERAAPDVAHARRRRRAAGE